MEDLEEKHFLQDNSGIQKAGHLKTLSLTTKASVILWTVELLSTVFETAWWRNEFKARLTHGVMSLY